MTNIAHNKCVNTECDKSAEYLWYRHEMDHRIINMLYNAIVIVDICLFLFIEADHIVDQKSINNSNWHARS